MTSRLANSFVRLASVAIVMLTTGYASPAQPEAAVQTLCILDFQRTGDDSRSDWLEQGLADLMIGTMSALSPYLVIERRHLQEILREHGLSASGVVDVRTAARRAQLAKAQLLLQGSFAQQGDQVTIQVRLIRVLDQQVLSLATWTDRYDNLLAAPRALAARLLKNEKRPPDFGRRQDLETLIPRSIDVAESYYQGLRAFDGGRYHDALAHYLDAARTAGSFRKAPSAVLEMYYLLGRSDHAVLFARNNARSFEATGEVPAALEYYFVAARECLSPLNDLRLARDLLQKLLDLVEQHERRSREIAGIKRSILNRIQELQETGQSSNPETILSDKNIRYQVWVGDIEAELTRRAEEQARGGITVLENGRWVKEPVPPPSVLMWKIRALGSLARANARSGEIGPALDSYRALLEEYEFLAPYLPGDQRWLASIKTEAHFMLLQHYGRTGQLIRDHAMNRINRLNLVTHRRVFTRDFRNPQPDPRARVASRYNNRGYEYFDFAAAPGYQIDSVTIQATVEGIAEFGLDLPHPAGWPPQYSFSKRFARVKFSKQGSYQRTLAPPRGTEFLSIGTAWGPGLFSNTRAEVEGWKLNPPKSGEDLVLWTVTFTVSPKAAPAKAARGPDARVPLDPAVQSVISRYAAGWEHVSVVRPADSFPYAGNPRLDVYEEEWLVYSLEGDIRIFHQRNPRLEVVLPVTINSREREFDPSLVRTHDGQYALLWARGTSKTNAMRFVAFSADLLQWETPRRLFFEESSEHARYTYAQVEPLERTYNIVPVRRSAPRARGGGYVMLLAQGFVRLSDDLITWGPARKTLPQDLHRNRLVRGRDGTVWALYESSSPERQPYTPADWLHGFFVVDGKQYRHVTELRVSRSVDGIIWEASGTVTLPGQPSALWAFPVDERRIGIALGFNNLSLKWLTASPFDDLKAVDSSLPLMHQSDDAEWFVRDAQLTCIRPIFDPARQTAMLLATSTGRIFGGTVKP